MSAPPTTKPVAPERLVRTPAAYGGASPAADADSLAPYLSALRKRMRLIAALSVLGAGAGLTFALSLPPNYMASAAFIASEPSSLSSSLGALGNVASQLGIPALSAVATSSASASAQFYGDLLTSNTMLQAVVTTRFRASGDSGGKPVDGTLMAYLGATGDTPADRTISAMRKFKSKVVRISVDRPTGTVRFEVRTQNRILSALVARRLLDLVNEFNLRRRQTQAGAERDFVERRTQAAIDTLRLAESELAAFRARNMDFTHSPTLSTREAELQRRVALSQQLYTTIAQRFELAKIEAVRNTPVVTVLDAPEGLVQLRPRHVMFFTLAGLLGAFVFSCILALSLERVAATR